MKKPYYFLYAILILLTLILGPGCFKSPELIYSTAQDAQFTYEIKEDVISAYSPALTLSPGVYQIQVVADDLPADAYMVVSAAYDSNQLPYNAVKYNPVVIHPGQENKNFEVYIQYSLSDFQLHLNLCNADSQVIHSVSLCKTAFANRMALVLIYAATIVILLLIRLRGQIVSGAVPVSRQLSLAGLLLSCLICFFPYLNDYFTLGTDTMLHLTRIEALKEALLHAGQFPVRISDAWLYGKGYMDSALYSDLFLYVPALLRIIGFPLGFAAKAMVLTSIIAIAAVSFHCFYKCTQSDYAALFGTFFIMTSPQLFHMIYSESMPGAYMSMIFVPMVFAGTFLLYKEDITSTAYKQYKGDITSTAYKQYKWYLIIGLTGLLHCHVSIFAVAVISLLAWCLIKVRKTFRPETFLQLLQAACYVLLLNCFFWLPNIYLLVKGAIPATAMMLFTKPVLLTPVISIGGGVLSLFILWIKGHMNTSKKDVLMNVLIVVLVLAMLIPALYLTNNFAYNTEPFRLYSAASSVLIDAGSGDFTLCYKELPLFILADLISLLTVMITVVSHFLQSAF